MRHVSIGSRRHALSRGLAGGLAAEVARVVSRGVGRLWDHGEHVRAVGRVRVRVRRVGAITGIQGPGQKKKCARCDLFWGRTADGSLTRGQSLSSASG